MVGVFDAMDSHFYFMKSISVGIWFGIRKQALALLVWG